MLDIQSQKICENDLVVYIQNKRGDKPRLEYAIVETENAKSIIVRFVNGEKNRLTYSHRSFADGRMNNLVVITHRPVAPYYAVAFDCTDYPVFEGDKVAFMEVPSQGFSTSLVIGKVSKLSADSITIVVNSKAEQKYMRKPDQVVVVEPLQAI